MTPAVTPTNKPMNSAGKVVPPLGFGAFSGNDDEIQGSQGSLPNVSRSRSQKGNSGIINVGRDAYTKEEIDVLR